MRDRSEQILRIACLTLVALVLLQLIYVGFQINPLAGVKIPTVPTLETNANSTATSASKVKPPRTGLAVETGGTNKIMTSPPTNPMAAQMSGGTNLVSTNVMAQTATNSSAVTGAKVSTAPTSETNANVNVSSASMSNTTSTNSLAEANDNNTNAKTISTNLMTVQTSAGTNLLSTNAEAQTMTNNKTAAGTNPVVAGAARISRNNLPPAMAMAGEMRMGGGPMMPGMPGNAPKLPPEIQARVDQIVNSEIFAPIMHPMPMGLLGIAGDTAFLRAPNGQTGLVKAGDSLGDVKLLKIGVNRVLVEQDGKEQELTIFDGYGGDSLLSKPDETSK